MWQTDKIWQLIKQNTGTDKTDKIWQLMKTESYMTTDEIRQNMAADETNLWAMKLFCL